jgi:mevalonate kinase
MTALGAAGRDAAAAVERGDLDDLGRAMRATWRERVRLEIADATTSALVDAAEAAGAAATSAGSGGAAVALVPSGTDPGDVQAAWRSRLDPSARRAHFTLCDVQPSPTPDPRPGLR